VSRRPFGIDIVSKVCLVRRSLLVFFCWGKGSIRECAAQVTWCKIEWFMTTVQLGRGRAWVEDPIFDTIAMLRMNVVRATLPTKVFQGVIAKSDFTNGL
jgi:hypothetical protein